MSKNVISQKVKYICEGCKKEVTYELVDATDDTVYELQNWRTVIREILHDGQWVQLRVGACSRECLATADAVLKIPDPRTSTDGIIDMNSLRASNIQ